MFGYVTAAKEHLSAEEYDILSAYYCGVCKAAGRRASQVSRLALSYDITFLALVLSSLSEDICDIKNEHCAAHHIRRRRCVRHDAAVDYAAEAGAVLQYLKFADDWHDNRSIKALVCMIMFYPAYRRVSRRRSDMTQTIRSRLTELSRLEESRCASVDDTADCFAEILRYLFTPNFVKSQNDRRALGWFGYNLGRWIYIIDAVNDLEEDIADGAYNPFAEMGLASGAECAKFAEPSLTFTLVNIASAFELINFEKNKSIVGKMVYTSLKQKQRAVLAAAERKSDESIRGSRSQ